VGGNIERCDPVSVLADRIELLRRGAGVVEPGGLEKQPWIGFLSGKPRVSDARSPLMRSADTIFVRPVLFVCGSHSLVRRCFLDQFLDQLVPLRKRFM